MICNIICWLVFWSNGPILHKRSEVNTMLSKNLNYHRYLAICLIISCTVMIMQNIISTFFDICKDTCFDLERQNVICLRSFMKTRASCTDYKSPLWHYSRGMKRPFINNKSKIKDIPVIQTILAEIYKYRPGSSWKCTNKVNYRRYMPVLNNKISSYTTGNWYE